MLHKPEIPSGREREVCKNLRFLFRCCSNRNGKALYHEASITYRLPSFPVVSLKLYLRRNDFGYTKKQPSKRETKLINPRSWPENVPIDRDRACGVMLFSGAESLDSLVIFFSDHSNLKIK